MFYLHFCQRWWHIQAVCNQHRTEILVGLQIENADPIDFENAHVARQLQRHRVTVVFPQGIQIAQFIGNFCALCRWLRTNATKKMSFRASAIVIQFGDFDRFRIEYFDDATADAMTLFRETAAALWHRWLEIFGNVNVAEIVLCAQIVNGKPFYFGDFLIVGQSKRKIFVEISVEDIGSARRKTW